MQLALLSGLLPPLADAPGLTSGFGEYRAGGRFHAGLDYSTGGRVGRPVRAVEDGWVERVRASGVGYGRSVYLRLADGRTAVYGHLDGFAPELAAYVAARQEAAGEYEQDLWPERGAFSFTRGQVLASSGQSGAGPPHLHLEIRRGDMNLHPLTQGIAVADDTAPTIAGLTITPVGASSRVAGGVDPWRGAWPARGDLLAPEVEGPFRLALDTWDRIGERRNRLATYHLSARLDGETIFESGLDSVSWGDMAIADRVFDLAATFDGVTHRRRLDVSPRDRTGIARRGTALITAAPGPHRLEFVARDEAGNETRRWARLTVRAAAGREDAPPPPRPHAALLAAAAPGRPAVAARDDVVFVVARAGDRRPPFEGWPELGLVDSIAVAGGELWICDAPRVASPMVGPSGVFLAGRGDGSTILLESSRARVVLTWSADAFHQPAAIVTSTAPLGGGVGAGLVVVSPNGLTLEPVDLALARPVRLEWREEPGPRRGGIGLFRRSGSSWSLVGDRDSGGAWSATTRRLGTFALLADTTAPKIVLPARYAARAGVTPPAFSARVSDAGAGLVAAAQRVLLDGQRVPAEYDPESDRLTWRPRLPLSSGAHIIEVEALDALGNRSSVRLPIEVR